MSFFHTVGKLGVGKLGVGKMGVGNMGCRHNGREPIKQRLWVRVRSGQVRSEFNVHIQSKLL